MERGNPSKYGVRNVNHSFVILAPSFRALNIRVCDLSSQKAWNVSLLHMLFPPLHVNVILGTPLSPVVTVDDRIWYPNSYGTYTVLSVYRLAMVSIIDSAHLCSDGQWLRIWNLKVPTRVKLFLWRVCSDCLPNRS